jgi:hypothetical protein
MRVPSDPEPPAGAPQSVRIFRAAENFYKLRFVGWSVTQLVGVAGIVFWITMLGTFADRVNDARNRAEIARVRAAAARLAPAEVAPAPTPASPDTSIVAPAPDPSAAIVVAPAAPSNPPAEKATKKKARSNRGPDDRIVSQVPPWAIRVLRGLELLGIAGFVAQLPITLAMLRLDFELRWYIVTDRSLRIRSGIWRVQEMTMSFANIQQVAVTRGPIQGLLKISDVRVQSAGGGGGDPAHGQRDTLHTGVFHGVANAHEIRDLILERLRQFRATGLGDPDDAHDMHAPPPVMAHDTHSALEAAREVLAEARALRAAL